MTQQFQFTLPGFKRGIHLITQDVEDAILSSGIDLPESGLFHLYTCHCSCAITMSENYDPDVRSDMEDDLERLVPENQQYYRHTLEGPDDMPSHTKGVLIGPGLTIPIVNGKVYFGTWQGIYFFEFRNSYGPRSFIATIIS